MTFSIHPDSQLVDLFSKKPYQGANPSDAKVLVLGNDANYSSEITNHDFFKRIIEYHRDGVKFWKIVGVHHPFLLDDYPREIGKAGVRHHKKFAKMGFNAAL